MGGSERLDSWKAIADYLARDVATTRRWEKTLGLPVRRVPGGRGHSVFAFVSEIDEWLASTTPRSVAADPPLTAPDPVAIVVDDAAPSSWRWKAATAVVGLFAVTGIAWAFASSPTDAKISTVQVSPEGLRAFDASGHPRWTYPFEPGDQVVPPDERIAEPAEVLNGLRPTVLLANSYTIRRSDKLTRSGELVSLSSAGSPEHRFVLDDQLAFGDGTYAGPWTITDFRVEADPSSRIAVAAHHYQWWPSIVTILDPALKRLGTFVNPGWVQRVHWMSHDRLLVTGFSNDRNGAMLALIDPSRLDAQAPAVAEDYRCSSCGTGMPLRYLILPRSELNRVTGSPFNRVVLEVTPDRLSVRTIEVPAIAQPADVIYELSSGLDIARATYSDRYWEVHRVLETQGKLTHTREQCPERGGPPSVQLWEPATGWRTIRLRH